MWKTRKDNGSHDTPMKQTFKLLEAYSVENRFGDLIIRVVSSAIKNTSERRLGVRKVGGKSIQRRERETTNRQ